MSRASALRKNATAVEARLWTALRGSRLSGWKFRRQHPIDRFVVDFVCLAARLVVEVDGATHNEAAAMERDVERTRIIEAAGFQVIRFQNTDIRNNLDGVLDTILAALSPRDPA